MDDRFRHIEDRFDDVREPRRSEMRRMEEVIGGRKHIER